VFSSRLPVDGGSGRSVRVYRLAYRTSSPGCGSGPVRDLTPPRQPTRAPRPVARQSRARGSIARPAAGASRISPSRRGSRCCPGVAGGVGENAMGSAPAPRGCGSHVHLSLPLAPIGERSWGVAGPDDRAGRPCRSQNVTGPPRATHEKAARWRTSGRLRGVAASGSVTHRTEGFGSVTGLPCCPGCATARRPALARHVFAGRWRWCTTCTRKAWPGCSPAGVCWPPSRA
jgi:hypothetical protein